MDVAAYIEESGYDSVVVFPKEYDEAFLGVSDEDRAVYSRTLLLQCLMRSMSEEDAVEWFEYNTLRSLPYTHKAPIIILTEVAYDDV